MRSRRDEIEVKNITGAKLPLEKCGRSSFLRKMMSVGEDGATDAFKKLSDAAAKLERLKEEAGLEAYKEELAKVEETLTRPPPKPKPYTPKTPEERMVCLHTFVVNSTKPKTDANGDEVNIDLLMRWLKGRVASA